MNEDHPDKQQHPTSDLRGSSNDETKDQDLDDGTETVYITQQTLGTLGSYNLQRELGRGGMGVVYQAEHAETKDCVALKMLNKNTVLSDGAQLQKFKEEFRALSDMNHPNLVGLHSLEMDEKGEWFFTMDLIDGYDFQSFVRPGGRLDVDRLRGSITQLAQGVMQLHTEERIHRDLKPGNVMVDRNGRVIILDFGLTLELGRRYATVTSAFQGTIDYAAPEQFTGQATKASDWYAVGTMLYKALTGKLPFADGTDFQIMERKQNEDAGSVFVHDDVPDDLGQLCMALLERDPGKRPSQEIIATVLEASTNSIRPQQHADSLIGRDDQLAELQGHLRKLREQRDVSSVFVSGRSGEGKSFLVEQFLNEVHRDDTYTVLAGRCYDREFVPYKALDSLIDGLCQLLRSLPRDRAALLVPDNVGFLARLFPVLQRVDVVAELFDERVRRLDDQQVRQRAAGALRSLLDRVCRRTPVILFIDDLQWGDADSAQLIYEALRPPEAPSVLLIGTYRSDEAEDSPFLKAWGELAESSAATIPQSSISVSPLSLSECESLVAELFGQDSADVQRQAARLFEETKGNLYLLVELVATLSHSHDDTESLSIHEVIEQKLDRLPDAAEDLLNVVAVAGHDIPSKLAAQAAGREFSSIIEIQMQKEKLLRRISKVDQDEVIDTYHDRVRETVLAELDATTISSIHLALGKSLEKEMSGLQLADNNLSGLLDQCATDNALFPQLYQLAVHYHGGKSRTKAWSYAFLAAEQALRQSALEVAADQYSIAAENCSSDADERLRYRFFSGYGKTLVLLGRYVEAKVQLCEARALAETVEERAFVDLWRGDIELKLGHMKECLEIMQPAARTLNCRVPSTSLGFVAGIVYEMTVQLLHMAFANVIRRKPGTRADQLMLQLLYRIFYVGAFTNSLRMIWSSLACLNRAQRVDHEAELARAEASGATLFGILGFPGISDRFSTRAYDRAHEADDLGVLGSVAFLSGFVDYTTGKFQRSLQRMKEAVDAFERAGDKFELNLSRLHVGYAYFALGDMRKALVEARKTFESSASIRDPRVGCCLGLWSLAGAGELDFIELDSCIALQDEDVLTNAHRLLGEGTWHLHHGRPQEAVTAFETAVKIGRQAIVINCHVIATLPRLVTALRARSTELQQTSPGEAKAILKRAWKTAKRACWMCLLLARSDYSYALRELAHMLAIRGKTRKALKYAQKSCRLAEGYGAKYEFALSLQLQAELAGKLGLPNANSLQQDADERLAALAAELQAGLKELNAT